MGCEGTFILNTSNFGCNGFLKKNLKSHIFQALLRVLLLSALLSSLFGDDSKVHQGSLNG